MSAFFDTNILVYAQQTDAKGDRARELFAATVSSGSGAQRVHGFVATQATERLAQIAEAVADVLTMVDPPLALTLDLHNSARALAQDHGLSFYDALIVSAAIEAGCDTLFSEDMQHGRSIGGLAIVNPFVDSAP